MSEREFFFCVLLMLTLGSFYIQGLSIVSVALLLCAIRKENTYVRR